MPKKETGRKEEFAVHAVCVGWITQKKPQWTPVQHLIIKGFDSGKNLRNKKCILTSTYFLKRQCSM